MKYKKGEFVTVPNRSHLHRLSSSAQSLFLWICIYADDDGVCYPSRSTLAKKMNCGVRTIDNYLKELVEEGFVVKTNREFNKEKQSNVYQIIVFEGGSADSALGSAKNDTTPSAESAHRTKSNITKPTELASCSLAQLGDENNKGDNIIYTPTNDDGDEISPRKPAQNFAVEKRVFHKFKEMCENKVGETPMPAKGWQLKHIRQALASGFSENRLYDVFEEWFDSGHEDQLLNVHSALSAHFLNLYKMKYPVRS